MSKVITKIEAQKKKDNRVNIFINGEFAFGCSSELVYYHSLAKGKEVDLNELNTIVKEDNYITGKTRALKYLETSLRSSYQVKVYLEKYEYEEDIIDRVIDFLKEYGFINDDYYAKAFVTENIKKQGKNNIKYKLLQKGISEDIIVKNLERISNKDEEEIAFKLAEKKANILCKSETDIKKIKMKLNTFLLSKGYSYDIIKSVIDKIQDNINLKRDEEYNFYNYKSDCGEDYILKEERNDELIELARKRYEKLVKSEQDTLKLKRKLQDFLLRKGYSYSEIKSVINKIVNGLDYEY